MVLKYNYLIPLYVKESQMTYICTIFDIGIYDKSF